MTKDVLLSIRGLQFVSQEEEEVEPVEVITAGDYYKKNGKHYIMYDEVTEGFDGNTRNVIKLTEDSLDITKKGISNVHMVFEKDKKNMTYYTTPYGSMMMGIDARSVSIEESEAEIHAQVEYGLDVNYEHLADCMIDLYVQSRERKAFSL